MVVIRELVKSEFRRDVHKNSSKMSLQSRISISALLGGKPLPEFREYSKNTKEEDFPCINILENIVLKKTKSNDEYENLKFFSDKVLDGVSEHFPLVYNHENKDGYDFIVMEKFDGDYKDFEPEDIDEVSSFYLQILMTLYTIDSYGKFHGDLNPGNVLYKKIGDDESDDGYLNYEIGGETYRVKHCNRLWVVSDFECMDKKGVALESKKDFDADFLKWVFREHYDKIKEPIKGSWLYDMYALATFTNAHKMAGRVFDLIQEGCVLNPVEAVPLIIKNDIEHLFIKESKGN
jgi:hypothetical protein